MLQQVQVTSLEEFVIQIVNTLFQTNNILSGLLIIAVVWGGRWFGRVAWADIVAYFKSKEETAERHFQVTLAADAERDKRAQENDKLNLEALMNVTGELRALVAVTETNRILLISLIRRNGKSKALEEIMDEVGSETQGSSRRG